MLRLFAFCPFSLPPPLLFEMPAPADITIRLIDPVDQETLARCHAVAVELRPQFAEVEEFVHAAIMAQGRGVNYAYLEHEGEVRSFAGFRICQNLSSGTHMYVDDLVTRAQDHGKGYGSAFFDWLVAEARRRDC
ncbi:MAG TPA: GNAT family N-acetyltransferase, partial [Candidatus Saccharimonadia bacterium]|nr:GNAT family N-acetyltransferase [Candidatus Saccharimonadia bacterium]